MKPIYIGVPPYSSPDPATEGYRMLPIMESETEAEVEAPVEEFVLDMADYSSIKYFDLVKLVKERGISAEGTKKADLIDALIKYDKENSEE